MSDQNKPPKKEEASRQPTSAETNQDSLDLKDFQQNVLNPYLRGKGEFDIPADPHSARSMIPPGTASQRSFANIASEFPIYQAQNCVGCMECVIACPDAAIHGRVTPEAEFQASVAQVTDPVLAAHLPTQVAKVDKFWKMFEKKGQTPGLFSLWLDPDKCKGCAECVQVCSAGGHHALKMESKKAEQQELFRSAISFVENKLPGTQEMYINPKLFTDLFLREDLWAYRGGAGACMGCGEVTALKMALTVTMAKFGRNMAIVAATGCNSVFSSTYPYNIFDVPWTNSLFENAPTTALGVRMRLNQIGKRDTKIWVVGGDGAMGDIGFQALSRALMSGENLNFLVLDTQVYSNTGGQASTATFMSQSAKMSIHGRSSEGKEEGRKELGLLALMHPNVYVAQVSSAYHNHFIRSVIEAVEYPGPSVIIAYAPCMPEHGVADDAASDRAKAAVVSRAFPIFVHDPRRGPTLRERLDLRGNPSLSEVWHKDPKTGEVHDFIKFARAEGRFAQHFHKDGSSSEILLRAQEERAKNWNLLRELAGVL